MVLEVKSTLDRNATTQRWLDDHRSELLPLLRVTLRILFVLFCTSTMIALLKHSVLALVLGLVLGLVVCLLLGMHNNKRVLGRSPTPVERAVTYAGLLTLGVSLGALTKTAWTLATGGL